MKFTRLKYWLLCSLLLIVGLYLILIEQFNGKPEVMMSETQPMFVSQCLTHNAIVPLDQQGRLRIAVWNIYKQQKKNWQPQLQQITDNSDLVLLQEAKLNSRFSEYLANTQHHVVMAKGFRLMNIPMGVMNISSQPANEACAYQTAEPLIRFAKSTLVATYPLSNGQQLLVVNLHGINFDWRLDHYESQLKQILKKVTIHHGPVILAGDLNTWRDGRMSIVRQLTQGMKLTEAKYKKDFRKRVFGLPLDHLFYRGLTLVQADSTETSASDHNPIETEFMLETL
ncbi:endonuclease/exonuclease/phosphatase family protein [Shewanella donghaensis]|uniref:endonuclease/exonuclease/phosphatase family protein n=1 Tax=Shewanella donghaensis TaxID=238836 RepID=UPI001D036185|nr:endonuclease/exonuclease/phosphatase family protein [Shewanella donghaensis]